MSLIQAALDKAEKGNKPVKPPGAEVQPPMRKLPKADLSPERGPQAPPLPPSQPAALLAQAALNAARKEASFMNIDPALQDIRRRRGFFSRGADPRIIFGVVAVLILFYLFSRSLVRVSPVSESRAPSPAIPAPRIPAPILSAPAAPVARPALVKSSTVMESKPGFLQSGSSIRLTLTGITVAGSDKLAVINNQVLSQGDTLREGAVVKTIAENTVTVTYEGRETVLSL